MKLSKLPRIRLASLPTPLQEMPNLSKELGLRILVKRDDLTGLAFGGN
jgi:L-cysteate sulfo-lyase